ncbi:MAG: tetratricopeptide repeat protein [bacterium]
MTGEKLDSLSVANKIVLLSVAIVPPMFATAFSSFDEVKWGVMMVLAGLGALALALDVARGRPVTFHGGRVVTIAYCFVAFALFAATYAPVPMLGVKDALTWAAGSFLFILGLSSSGRGIRFDELAIAASVAVTAVAATGLLEFAGVGLSTVVWNPIGPTGAFDSMELLGPFYAVTLPLLAAAVIRVSGPGKGLLGVGLLAGAVHFGLTVLPSHGIAILAATGFVTLMIVLLQKPARAVLLYPVFGVAFATSVLVFVLAMFAQSDEGFSDANRLPMAAIVQPRAEQLADGQPRVTTFAIGRVEEVTDETAWNYVTGIAFDLFRDAPIGGQGAGSWWVMQTRFPRAEDPYVARMFEQYPAFQSAHNSLAQMLAEYGAIGVLLFLAWMSAVAGMTVTAFARREESENWVIEHWGLTAAAFSFFVCSVQAPGLNFAGSSVVFFPVLALLVRESAVLNNFKGLSAPMIIGAPRKPTALVFFAGVPAVLGVAMIAIASVATVSNYHRGLADHLMLRTKFKEAAAQYELAHEAFPYRGEILYNEALTYRRIGKLGEAKEIIAQAAVLRPNDARVLFLSALTASGKQQTTDAIRDAKHALALFPNYIDAHKQLAIAYDMAGQVTDASNVLKATIDMAPPERFRAPLYSEMARYYEQALGQPKLASEAYTNAAKFTKDRVNREQYEFKAKELAKQVERDRLIREGKPVPESLMPAKPQEHNHGLPKNLQPNVEDEHGHEH